MGERPGPRNREGLPMDEPRDEPMDMRYIEREWETRTLAYSWGLR